MKNIGIVSFGTGGTMGHMSLTTNLSKFLAEKGHKIYLFSESNYSKFSNIGHKNFEIIKISIQKHVKTVGGCLEYKYGEEFMKDLMKKKIEVLIFSTFFDLNLVRFCNKKDIKCILISYPLRDSHRKAIQLRKYYYNFDRVFILKDIIDINKVSNKEFIVSPIKNITILKKRDKKLLNNILITCGGGGRPSSALFFKIIKKVVKKIYSLDKSIKFTIIIGNSNKRLKLPNSKILSWSKKFIKLLKYNDLVISEAGYFTILDLINIKIPAILIPGERRIDNQELRALKYQESGCGYMHFPNEDYLKIVNKVISLKKEKGKMKILSESYSKLNDIIFNKYPKLEDELLKFLKS